MTEHLDRALEEEFTGHGDTIHRLKVASAEFKALMEENHSLWRQIQGIQSGAAAASDATLEALEKQRLRVLDEIGARIRAAET